MTRTLLFLTKVGLRSRTRTSLVGLLTILTITAATINAGISLRHDGSETLDAAAVSAHRPDFTVWGRPAVLRSLVASPELLAGGIAQVSPLRPISGAELMQPGGETGFVLATTVASRPDQLNQPHLMGGRLPSNSPADATNIAVEPKLGKIGSSLTIRTLRGTTVFTVVGNVTDFSMCSSQCGGPGRLFLSSETFAKTFGDGDPSATAESFTVHDPRVFNSATISSTPGIKQVYRWTDVRSQLLAPEEVTGGFVVGLGLFMLCAALVILFSVVSAQMALRQREFALHATVGATRVQLACAAIIEQLVLTLFASIMGWVLGTVMSPITRSGLSRSLGGTGIQPNPILLVQVTIAMMVGAAAVVGFTVVRAATKPIIVSLRQTTIVGATRVPRVHMFPGSVLPTALSEAMGKRLRTLTAIVAVAIAVSGSTTAWQLRSTVGYMAAPEHRVGTLWDISLWSITAAPTESFLPDMQSLPNAGHVFTSIQLSGTLEVHSRGTSTTERNTTTPNTNPALPIKVHLVGGDGDTVAHNVTSGRSIKQPGEVLIGTGAAELAGLRLNETATFRVRSHTYSARIVGMFRDVNNGRSLTARLQQIRSMDPDAPAGSIRMRLDPNTDRVAMLRLVQKRIRGRGQAVMSRGPEKEVRLAQTALGATGLMIAILAVGQLGSSFIIGARQNRRELATWAALGFSRGQLAGRGAIICALSGFVGSIIAIPIATFAFHRITIQTLERARLDTGIVESLGSPISMINVLIATTTCALVGAVATHISMRAVSSIDLGSQ